MAEDLTYHFIKVNYSCGPVRGLHPTSSADDCRLNVSEVRILLIGSTLEYKNDFTLFCQANDFVFFLDIAIQY